MKLSNILIICAILSSSSVLLVNGAARIVDPGPVIPRIVGIEKNSNEKRRHINFGPGAGFQRDDEKKKKIHNEKRGVRYLNYGPGKGLQRNEKRRYVSYGSGSGFQRNEKRRYVNYGSGSGFQRNEKRRYVNYGSGSGFQRNEKREPTRTTMFNSGQHRGEKTKAYNEKRSVPT